MNKGTWHQRARSFVECEEGTVVFVVSRGGPIMVLENARGVLRREARAQGGRALTDSRPSPSLPGVRSSTLIRDVSGAPA
ncbi:hypothetical protein OJF2_52280 [Aquisphaera giovannonii]|uniref:Uncharacterized protein n=1 Tax=Aquisphaera giovannonii TaxID=406548 RepID=A0A5B9W7V4_9BACT|nr:hypothetical protein [Aquisphaera giovannonii]QEH36643.1 hypothetical protein OJF2_52280 [Aquisphaera giovannonii]